jgi:hypothetical protein
MLAARVEEFAGVAVVGKGRGTLEDKGREGADGRRGKGARAGWLLGFLALARCAFISRGKKIDGSDRLGGSMEWPP